MSWIQVVLDFLRQFWPFQIVYSYQRAVRFWCGRDIATLGPGLYMTVPFFMTIDVLNVQPDIHRLENQNLTTKDGRAVLASLNIAYRITDVRKAFVNVNEPIATLANAARTFLATEVREYEFAELLHSQTDLEEACVEAINEVSADWGIEVTSVGLADFVATKSLSLGKI